MKEEISYEEENSWVFSDCRCFIIRNHWGVGIPAFAATNTPAAEQSTKTAKKDLDDATKQKVKTIMDDTKKQLEELGVKLPEKEKT